MCEAAVLFVQEREQHLALYQLGQVADRKPVRGILFALYCHALPQLFGRTISHADAGSGNLLKAPRETVVAKDLVPAHVKPRQARSITSHNQIHF